MAGHLLFNSGSNESSLAPQFKWLDNTFNMAVTKSLKNIRKLSEFVNRVYVQETVTKII